MQKSLPVLCKRWSPLHNKRGKYGNTLLSTEEVRLQPDTKIDDLRKSIGLHSVSAYRHGLYMSMLAGVAQSRPAFVRGTVNTWAR